MKLFKNPIRKPSVKKIWSSYTSPKKQFINRTGLKMPNKTGWARSPKRFVHNTIYAKTTFSITDRVKRFFKNLFN